VSDQFIAEIRIFSFNFPPQMWATCNGQLLPVTQNNALFSIIGNYYGGDGKTNFALPNFQGNSALHQGQQPGGTLYNLGQRGGAPTVTLQDTQMANHNHALQADARPATLNNPSPQNALARSSPNIYKAPTGAATVQMAGGAVGMAGSGQPHNNLMPYLTLNFCIAIAGILPSRS
jgi:microcystin-dependent protein